jgi:hypothetical protein
LSLNPLSPAFTSKSAFFTKNAELDGIYEGHLDNVDSLLDKAKSSN